ncbi:hypothetical protein Ddye_002640 [Dipteronia dyeriana]|uniref:HMA domain-containing protein n=1 Tax=Dipteronia dyeriana TaxID=168575 RepID=A0AAD9XQN8_9ROSI|nr:hypothetical protein Ddye_002640 [Dipteronia dyeriana]
MHGTEGQVVVKMMIMNDENTKQKAIEAVADVYSDLKEQKLTVTGDMDTVAIARNLKKIGKIEILSVGPANDEKKEDKKEEKKEEKK